LQSSTRGEELAKFGYRLERKVKNKAITNHDHAIFWQLSWNLLFKFGNLAIWQFGNFKKKPSNLCPKKMAFQIIPKKRLRKRKKEK
jgi:hypothetical protein